jgi:hypothetical protein
MAMPAIISTVMYMVVWFGRQFMAGLQAEVVQLIVLILAGMCAYSVLTIVINKAGYKEVIGLMKR